MSKGSAAVLYLAFAGIYLGALGWLAVYHPRIAAGLFGLAMVAVAVREVVNSRAKKNPPIR